MGVQLVGNVPLCSGPRTPTFTDREWSVMSDDHEGAEPIEDEEPDEDELSEDEPDEDSLVEDIVDDLAEDEEFEAETDEDEDEEEDDDEEEDEATPRTRRRAAEDEDDEDEDLLSPDDVEADLDRILKDRMVTSDEEDDDEEDEDEGLDDSSERGEGTGRLQPKRADEQLCSTCFLLVRSSAPSCPVGDDDCPIFTS
jgi:hypothetical protein